MTEPHERRGDWEKGVDENLAMLNSAQRSTDKELADLDRDLAKHDRMLHGDMETSGLIGRIEATEHLLTRLEACVFSSPGNHNGLDMRVSTLEDENRTSGFKWSFATSVTVALIGVFGTVIGLLGLLIMNWDKIDTMVQHYRHPQELKPGKRRGHVREVTTPEEEGRTWK